MGDKKDQGQWVKLRRKQCLLKVRKMAPFPKEKGA